MIISHKYKFIFIKTFKTASSSFEAAYSWIAGPEDILPPDEPAGIEYKWFQNYEGTDFFNHMHAVDIKKSVSAHVWDNYYKFCIERNPWDKAVSWYYWNRQFWVKEGKDKTPSEFVLNHLPLPDWPMYTIDNQVVVDRILRFEALPAAIADLAMLLGLPKINMPRVKGSFRPDGIHYKDVWGPSERKKIANVFHKTIKLMNYKYQEGT